jgi:hypothetical protein
VRPCRDSSWSMADCGATAWPSRPSRPRAGRPCTCTRAHSWPSGTSGSIVRSRAIAIACTTPSRPTPPWRSCTCCGRSAREPTRTRWARSRSPFAPGSRRLTSSSRVSGRPTRSSIAPSRSAWRRSTPSRLARCGGSRPARPRATPRPGWPFASTRMSMPDRTPTSRPAWSPASSASPSTRLAGWRSTSRAGRAFGSSACTRTSGRRSPARSRSSARRVCWRAWRGTWARPASRSSTSISVAAWVWPTRPAGQPSHRRRTRRPCSRPAARRGCRCCSSLAAGSSDPPACSSRASSTSSPSRVAAGS